MSSYELTIPNNKGKFPIAGLNELLNGRIYNYRTKKYHNPVKTANDNACRKAIRKNLNGVHIDHPITCVFTCYLPNKRHDRGNISSAVEKSFLDALQLEKVIKNDGWFNVGDSIFHTYIDKANPRVEVLIAECKLEKE